jgi:hypothetical protein
MAEPRHPGCAVSVLKRAPRLGNLRGYCHDFRGLSPRRSPFIWGTGPAAVSRTGALSSGWRGSTMQRIRVEERTRAGLPWRPVSGSLQRRINAYYANNVKINRLTPGRLCERIFCMRNNI